EHVPYPVAVVRKEASLQLGLGHAQSSQQVRCDRFRRVKRIRASIFPESRRPPGGYDAERLLFPPAHRHLLRMNSILDGDLFEIGTAVVLRDPKPQIVIFSWSKRYSISTDRGESFTAQQHGGLAKRTPRGKGCSDFAVLGWKVEGPQWP